MIVLLRCRWGTADGGPRRRRPDTSADLRKPAPPQADKVAFMGGVNTTSLPAGP
jgi:hypothetical protein